MDKVVIPGIGTFPIKNEAEETFISVLENENQDSFDSIRTERNIDKEKRRKREQRMENINENYEIQDDSVHYVDDGDSDFFSSMQSKPRRKRKSTAGIRKIQHVWKDDEIKKLIASVEQHPGLWNIASPEYKLSKLDGWRSVVNELEIDGVNVNEAKVKWSSLRTTFMVNLTNLRKKKSGRKTNGSHTVSWKFFKAMKFLKTNNLKRSNSIASTLPLESATVDTYIVEELPILSHLSTPDFVRTAAQEEPNDNTSSQVFPQQFDSVEESVSQLPLNNLHPTTTTSITTTPEFSTSNRHKRLSSRTPSPPLSPSPSCASTGAQTISILNSTVAAMHSTDTNSTFCDNLLAELRTLSESKARTLRYKISRLMMDFIEAVQDPPQLSSDKTGKR